MSKILVIDDDEGIRMIARKALEFEAHEVIEAVDGLEGVKLARASQPDLILCDIYMERLDGYATVNVLRLHPATATIPLILMTGKANMESMRRGMSLGADDYLVKPFTVAVLLAAVKLRLAKRAAAQEESNSRLAELRTNIAIMLPHELLTPLNGILGLADIIANDSAKLPAATVAEFGRDIRVCGVRLERMVKNFITFVQTELVAADPVKLATLRSTPPVDLAALLGMEAETSAAVVQRLGDLRQALTPVAAPVQVEHFRIMAAELLANAFKFSPLGTEVDVGLAEVDGAAQVTVQDRGRGIETADLTRVGAFMQFDRQRHEQQGAGLGLVITRRLAELYGGELKLTSEPGKGTTAFLILPKEAVAVPPVVGLTEHPHAMS